MGSSTVIRIRGMSKKMIRILILFKSEVQGLEIILMVIHLEEVMKAETEEVEVVADHLRSLMVMRVQMDQTESQTKGKEVMTHRER